jgi:UDP-4-amino-4-deoxy-L-arabinose formyltransferase/UDP-glucuronic acid dehydrogenase (UDP-4-keto-hexauronic acid decarboxylating)
VSAVVFAYHDVGCMGLRTLKRLGVEIAQVYTHADDPQENTWFGSVRRTCEELRLPVKVGADPHAPEELAHLARLAPRAIFSFYWRDLLKESVLALGQKGAVNLHGSLLPRYRGRAPVNWQLLHGERQGGVTLHHMVKKADAGDIVDQEPFVIGPDDKPTDVFESVLAIGELVLTRSALAVIEGNAPRIEQLESKATLFGRRRPEDGAIHWRQSAEDVRNLVRAVTRPYPGAFTFAAGKRVLVWWSAHDARASRAGAGEAHGQIERRADGVYAVCGDRRLLRLCEVEIEGRLGDALEFPELLGDGARLGPATSGA